MAARRLLCHSSFSVMPTSDEEFLKRLLEAFKIEAGEHVQAMSSGLLELESSPAAPEQRAPLIERIFREAHSLKGAARAVNVTEVESLCQALETVFSAWKRKEMEPAPEQFDALHRAVDLARDLLSAGTAGRTAQVVAMTQQLAAFKPGATPPAAPRQTPATPPPQQPQASSPVVVETVVRPAPVPQPQQSEPSPSPVKAAPQEEPPVAPEPRVAVAMTVPPIAAETVRISTAKLDSVLLQAEEMLVAKLAIHQRVDELRGVEAELERWQKEWTKIEPEARRLRSDKSAGSSAKSNESNEAVAAFLDWSQSRVKALEGKLAALAGAAERDHRALSTMVDNLLEETKKLVMLPFSTLLEIFPRLVRDLARDEGKDVHFTMRGGDVEIDKRILEEMKDPLIHLLRNCVDHGIEPPAKRAPKPARATITLFVSQASGSEVEITVSDDGRGISVPEVKAAAVKKGTVSAEEAARMDDQQAIMLIFQSDVSTSPIITEISGRGLGLAIVREKILKLRGRIAVETRPGAGTTFRIALPLTLATFKGIIVRASEQLFVVPVTSLTRVVLIKPDEVQTVENRETIPFEGRVVSLVRLDDALEIPRKNPDDGDGVFSVLILGSAEKQIGFRVDAVVNEQEVLVKPLGKPLVRVRNVAAATVLGDGKPVPILNVSDLMKSALHVSGAVVRATALESTAAEPKKKIPVLVVEDSITSRMLLKNILESAGYAVTTAVDGMDGLTKLRTG
jgi:two-component system chemotaxis sensor kinase CheA